MARRQALGDARAHRVVDAGDGEAVEGNVASMNAANSWCMAADRLQVIEVLGIDVGDDADLVGS